MVGNTRRSRGCRRLGSADGLMLAGVQHVGHDAKGIERVWKGGGKDWGHQHSETRYDNQCPFRDCGHARPIRTRPTVISCSITPLASSKMARLYYRLRLAVVKIFYLYIGNAKTALKVTRFGIHLFCDPQAEHAGKRLS